VIFSSHPFSWYTKSANNTHLCIYKALVNNHMCYCFVPRGEWLGKPCLHLGAEVSVSSSIISLSVQKLCYFTPQNCHVLLARWRED